MRIKHRAIGLVLLLAQLLFFGNIFCSETAAEESVDKSITLHNGFFMPSRGIFRDLYGNYISSVLEYEQSLNSRIALSIQVGYLSHLKRDINISYRNIFFRPTIKYNAISKKNFSFYAAIAPGLNFRKIGGEFMYTDASGFLVGTSNQSQNDFGPSILFAIGGRVGISQNWFIDPRVSYDYIYDSNPDLGDFGNTGGYNFSLGVGVQL